MANYVQQTWVDGNPSNPVSAARMAHIEQGVFDSHFQPAARVFHNAAQSIATSTTTTLAFNSERFDTDTIHDTVTNNSRLTCKTAGKYLIGGNVEWSGGTGANSQIQVFLNAATVIAYDVMAGGSAEHSRLAITTFYDLAVNDFVELRVFQASGGSININSTGNYSPEFWMSRLA